MSVGEKIKASYLPRLEKFWKVVWIEEKSLKKEQAMDDDVFHYLDFGEHFPAVHSFCHSVPEKLYIHQEYPDAFEMFESNSKAYRKGACIIGQPGIGKTCFIVYAVYERLRKKEPVAVEVTKRDKSTGRYLLFTAEGVTLHHGWDTDDLERHSGIWAFSDSNAHILIPMAAFTNTPGVRTFQVTSPREVRYKEWIKQSEVSRYVMNIPSEKDIQHLSLVLDKDVTIMQSLAAQWGNIPRTLLALYRNPGIRCSREHRVRKEVAESTKDINGVRGALNALDTTSSDGPSTIFFIQPLRRENGVLDRQDHSIFIPTPWLRDEVVKGLARREDAERMKLYEGMTGSTKGWG